MTEYIREKKSYESLVRFMSNANKKTLRKVTKLRIPKGDYTEFPDYMKTAFQNGGELVMEGLGDPVRVAGTFTVAAATGIGAGIPATDITVDEVVTWTENEFAGYFIRVIGGDRDGKIFNIFGNTTDTLRMGFNDFADPLADDDVIEICRPPVRITVDHPIGFEFENLCGDEESDDYYQVARVIMSGIEFVNTQTNPATDNIVAPFSFIGVGEQFPIYMNFCKFTMQNEKNYLKVGNVNINDGSIQPIYADPFVGSACCTDYPCVQVVSNAGTVPTDLDDNIVLDKDANLAGFCCRGRLDNRLQANSTRGNKGGVSFSTLGGAEIQGGQFGFTTCYFETAKPASEVAIVSDFEKSDITLFGCNVEAAKDCIELLGGSIQAAYTDNKESNVSGYGLRIGRCGVFVDYGGCDLSGTTEDIYFENADASQAQAWPAAGAVKTDSKGSFVLQSVV